MLSKFGIIMRMIRSSKNESLRSMASKLGISAPFLSNMENGEKNIPLEYADRVRDLYELDYDTYKNLVDSIMESNHQSVIDVSDLSPKQINEVKRFIEHLKMMEENIMNIDPPKMSEDFLKHGIKKDFVEKNYETIDKCCVTQPSSEPNIKLIQGDITTLDVSAIVNAANSSLSPLSGLSRKIFMAAGFDELADECQKIGHCEVGYAVITKGYNLKAKYIIHAVGPNYKGFESSKLLAMAYYNSLKLANDYQDITTIAFPSISTGLRGYPITKAVPISLKAIHDFYHDYPDNNINEIIICAYSDDVYNEYKKYI